MLTTSTRDLFWLLGSAVCLGFCFAAAYDVLRVLRILLGIPRGGGKRPGLAWPLPPFAGRGRGTRRPLDDLTVNLGDLVYFVLIGAVTAVFLSAAADGRLRWLTIAGIGLGFLLYRLTLGRFVIFFSQVIADGIRFLLLWTLWGIWIPLSRICTLLGHILQCAAGFVRALCLPIYTELVLRRELRAIRRIYFEKTRRNTNASVRKQRIDANF